MMMFEVPFLPEESYTEFLLSRKERISSVYFALPQEEILDSRFRFTPWEMDQLTDHLTALKNVKKYLLVNTRFLKPELYFETAFYDRLTKRLHLLMKRDCLDGFVFCDSYFLKALSDHAGKELSDLEASPGVNAMIDSWEKAVAHLDLIRETRFRQPEKLVLDRSLNRNMEQLASVSMAVKNLYPKIRIHLLANEGCLYHCPFKPAHDAHISLANTGLVRERTFEINREKGCMALLADNPSQFFKSPFIRPEDIDKYTHIADGIKLCGRTLGDDFLRQCLGAYFTGSFSGNLLDLMDAASWMAPLFYIDNGKIEKNFHKQLTTCTRVCKDCSFCDELFQRIAFKQQSIIQDNRTQP